MTNNFTSDGEKLRNLLKTNNITQEEFSKKIDVTRQTVSRWLKLSKISKSNWLVINHFFTNLTENNFTSGSNLDEAVVIKNTNFPTYPIVTRYSYDTYLKYWNNKDYVENLDRMPANVPTEKVCRWFEVKGDSMANGKRRSLEENDEVLGEFFPPNLWEVGLTEKISQHTKWVITHKDKGVLIRSISFYEPKEKIITCRALNSMYKDIKINLSDVYELYFIIKVSRNT